MNPSGMYPLTDDQCGALISMDRYVNMAIRQELRLQEAHRALAAHPWHTNPVSGGIEPSDYTWLFNVRKDEQHYLVNAASHAVKAQQRAVTKGLPMPGIRAEETIWTLRDILEHWDKWQPTVRDPDDFDTHPWTKIHAGRRWHSKVQPGAWVNSHTSDGPELRTLSERLDLRALRGDLVRIAATVREHWQRQIEALDAQEAR